ncbi:MAG: hypothetical protein H7067_01460 [Burkholderiales bacterium]|nr:hypothetical protein [Opitutaceae bacterium]
MSDAPSAQSPKPSDSAKLSGADLQGPKPTGWRRLSPILIQQTNRGTRVQIAWKQAVVTLALLLVLAWFGLASSAYLFVKYRQGFPHVEFGHMLFYPTRKDAYRASRGDYLVARAKERLKEQKFREAFGDLRAGSSLSPGNRDGRMLLAQFYVVWQRPDLAQKNLIEGIQFNAQDREYLQTLFSFLLQRQADAEVMQIAEELLGKEPSGPAGGSPDDRVRLIAMARATAQFFRGNYDPAEDTLKKFRLSESIDGQILAIRIDWERGERDGALARLQALTEQAPDNEQVYTQYAAFLREAGRNDELRRLALLRQLSYPDRPRPRIDLLYIYDKGGAEASVLNGIENLFRDFPTNAEVLLALADFAANTGRPQLARRIYDYCKANNLPWEGAALMTVEAHVVAKQYKEALAASNQMQKENPEWGKRFYSVFNGLQAIANYGLSDVEAAQLFLSNFLNQAGVRADNLVAVSNRLLTVGAKDQARQVLAQAVRSDPLNQTALVGLIRLDLEAGNAESVATHIRALMTMRKPPVELLREAYTKLSSDRFLFTPGRTALLDDLRKTLDSAVSGTIRS